MTVAEVQAAALTLGVTVIVTTAVLQVSRRWRVVDVPNERSAHSRPTPTAGGIGISAGMAAGLLLAPVPVAWRQALLVALAILLVAAVDDLGRPLSVGRKLLLQLVAAAGWVLLAPATPVQLTGDWVLAPGPLVAAITVGWLMWLMNVFNFMDGIDGFTVTQTAAMGLAMALLLASTDSSLQTTPIILIAACLGFALFNAPPARLFMGDVGSLSLGFLLGTITLAVSGEGIPLWLSALPLSAYLVDTTYTMARRWLQGENVMRAHDQHLYQRLVQAGWSHLQVDAVALVVTGLFSAAAVFALDDDRILSGCCAATAMVLLGYGLWWKESRARA
ncbi:MAG TPA: glycosyltransferase family 4 protein [Candidatus Latescibacteria bacterium]|nr:UDP-phosphate N-acetylglucosaminyl 1-phosphate transferase [Gemmatimonadaceae bacterium]MDP6016364.1 glycosyltransferase family 4 protein [Candidatus Latescibacterota bacterium]HJP34159.1 glycosyltransferase family 4 protein [Candidatus Latescibacterota bacterium]